MKLQWLGGKCELFSAMYNTCTCTCNLITGCVRFVPVIYKVVFKLSEVSLAHIAKCLLVYMISLRID